MNIELLSHIIIQYHIHSCFHSMNVVYVLTETLMYLSSHVSLYPTQKMPAYQT